MTQRGRVGLLGPQQRREGRTRVGTLGFRGAVGQQCAHLVAVEAGDRYAVTGELNGSEEV